MENETLRLAAVQMQVHVGDLEWNLEHSLELMQEAANRHADLICFPESVLDGYALEKPEFPLLARGLDSVEVQRISEFARERAVWVMWTLAEKTAQGKVANSALLFDRQGQIRLHYQKSHLCTEVNEHIVYQYGQGYPVVELEKGFHLGAMICFDRHFPEVCRTMRLQGANLILHPSATDWFTPNPEHINHAMMRTRAYENRCYILSVNQVNFGGGSTLYDPWGEALAIAGREEEILLAEIDHARLENHPDNTFELLPHRRPELYKNLSK
jgi:predicted amidohydrolase